jgi:hypothetical protein
MWPNWEFWSQIIHLATLDMPRDREGLWVLADFMSFISILERALVEM